MTTNSHKKAMLIANTGKCHLKIDQEIKPVVLFVVCFVCFFSFGSIFWESSTNQLPPAIFFSLVEITWNAPVSLFRPWSVHSGSASWVDMHSQVACELVSLSPWVKLWWDQKRIWKNDEQNCGHWFGTQRSCFAACIKALKGSDSCRVGGRVAQWGRWGRRGRFQIFEEELAMKPECLLLCFFISTLGMQGVTSKRIEEEDRS